MARKKEPYTYLSKKKKPFYKKKMFILFFFVMITGVFGLYKVKASNRTYTVSIDQVQRKKKSTFKKGVFKNKDTEISFDSVEIGKDIMKAPIAYTFFSVTNKTKEPIKTSTILNEHVEIYQDLDNSLKKLSDLLILSSEFEDEQNVMDELIKPGATVEVAYASKLYKEDKPLSINFIDNRSNKKVIGTTIVELENK